MTQSTLDSAVCLTLTICRWLIALTSLHWLATDHTLWAGVACAALALTWLPGRVIDDPILAKAGHLVLAPLLAAHVVLGMAWGLYDTSAYYDKVMHVIGSAAVTAVLIVAALRDFDRRGLEVPLGILSLLVLGGAVSAGTLWEVFEFTIDNTGLFLAQRSLHDTMLDLVADTAGAVAVVCSFAALTTARTLWQAD